jgi:predicted MFS family arabinose efflux permease
LGKNEERFVHNDWTIAAVFRSGRFWATMAFAFFSLLGIYIVFVHHVQFLVDQGIDKMRAAFVLAWIGAISSLSRIFWGWLSDYIGRETTFTAGMVFLCAGVGALLLFETTGGGSYVALFFVCFGIGWGVTAPMFMSTAADIFKGRVFGLIYGMVEGGIGMAGAIGSWTGGFIYDRTGSYQTAFMAAIVVLLMSCVFIWLAAPRKGRAGFRR